MTCDADAGTVHCPFWLFPHPTTRPVFCTAALKASPAPTAFACPSVVGTLHCRSVFRPHEATVYDVRRTTLWNLPAATCRALDTPALAGTAPWP